jgi:hypothetical protein
MSLFRWGNSLAGAFGIAWAFTAYKYNWLNVGGGESEFKELWIIVSGVVPYIALGIWLIVLGLVVIVDWRRSRSVGARISRAIITLLLTPIMFFIADWYFHIGFPKSSV